MKGSLRWGAANALGGDASPAGTHWGPQQRPASRQGRVGSVIGGLRQLLTKPRLRQAVRATRTNVLTFFHTQRRWLPYDASLAAGLPVAPGVVESACGSVVKPRMEGEGKRWSLVGAEAILTWRSLKTRHDHARRDYGKFHARQGHGRLDDRKPQDRPMLRWRGVA